MERLTGFARSLAQTKSLKPFARKTHRDALNRRACGRLRGDDREMDLFDLASRFFDDLSAQGGAESLPASLRGDKHPPEKADMGQFGSRLDA